MALDIENLGDDVISFLTERHLAMLTTQRADGTPHLVAVGFSYDPDAKIARVITWGTSQKAINAGVMESAGQWAAVGQVDGGRWLSLSGPVRLVTEPAAVGPGLDRYAERYGTPGDRDDRAVIEIDVRQILGRG